jgi:signal transduction histidine kinase
VSVTTQGVLTTKTRAGGGAGSLARRTAVVSGLLSAVVGTAFLLLALAMDTLRDSESRANHALQVLVAANRLERVAVDVQNTSRGFVISGEPAFLVPWRQAQSDFAQQSAALERLARVSDEGQGQHAHRITQAGKSYIRDYSIPLVTTAQRDLTAARTVAVTEDGQRRADDLRQRFERFMSREQQIFAAGQHRADTAASQALVAASVGVAGSIALILLSGAYLARSVVRPVRRASAMAGRVAGGDLSARMPETGPAEVGSLERSFNAMANSLETSRDALSRVADEQAALRRVATLVARGVRPSEVFGAVAGEAGRLLGAQTTAVTRFEPDRTATIAGTWAIPGTSGLALPVGSRWPAEADTVAGAVLSTGQPARQLNYDEGQQATAAWARRNGIRSAAGSPIIVEGRLWGAVIAFSSSAVPAPADTEDRLLAFTELVAMAIANTESREQLAASRARVVAAADETRRRIERDLHDGTQQRLISLALELRAAEMSLPADQVAIREQWSRCAHGLTEVVDELREISRGLHPAILESAGLGPALRSLARRAEVSVPVRLRLAIGGQLPKRVAVATYYVVSEALTNAAKHARASAVDVDVRLADQVLRLEIRDDGAGGADPARGSGLIGLSDRVESVGGRIEITSPPGRGTALLVTIPVPTRG